MPVKNSSHFLKIVSAASVTAVILAAVVGIFLVFRGPLLSFLINRFTEYNVAYAEWGGNPLGDSEIRDLALSMKGKNIAVKARNAKLSVKEFTPAGGFKLALDVDMVNVTFIYGTGSGKAPDKADDVLEMAFGSGQEYRELKFGLYSDKEVFKVSDFSAYSENVRIEGNFSSFKRTDKIDVDVKLSFSSDLAARFDKTVRDNVLSPDENGWYSMILNYKGNPLFLKAIYSIAIPS
jgi:hypothetical protein